MATLPDGKRAEINANYCRTISNRNEPIAITKVQLRAAVDAADDWMHANAASFNNALPAAAKANLTAAQKAELLATVLLKRYKENA